MAMNALGLPLQLQASPLQIQDLLGGLQPGDLLKGRIVELLPEGKAIVNLRGQNVVAQLPPQTPLAKGSAIDLQVTQWSPADGVKTANLTLKLLPPAAENAAPAPARPLAAPAAPIAVLPPQTQLDQALTQARIPLSPATQQVARTLAHLGVPLTPQNLQVAVQAITTLLAAETPAPTAPAPSLPAPVREALGQAMHELRAAIPMAPPANVAPLQQALRIVQTALEPQAPPAPTPPAPATSAPIAPVPTQPSAPVVAGPHVQALPTTPQAVPAAAPATPAPVQLQVQQVAQAVAQVLATPQPAQVMVLQNVVRELSVPAAPIQNQAPLAAPMAAPTVLVPLVQTPVSNAAAPAPAPAPTPAQTAAPAPAPAPSPAPAPMAAAAFSPPVIRLVQREAVAPLQAAVILAPQPPTAEAFQAQVTQQIQALQDPASPPAQRLVAAVQLQAPQAPPVQILQTAVQALTQLQAQIPIQALPPLEPLTPPVLQQLFQAADVAAPRTVLQSLPIETVAEAVAWLQARELPPQRALVEAVAVFIQQDHDALPAAQRAVEQAQNLPPSTLREFPALHTAVREASQALQGAFIRADTPGLAQRLQAWASEQGLNLEAVLASDGEPDAPRLPEANAERPALRPALQRLEQHLSRALERSLPSDPATAPLQSALNETQNATRALSAVPLQVQGAPAYDTVHLPLPVAFGAELGGRLSVTWRQGRERELSEKDPVSVAVALNTGELGTVKVLMQVFKGSATARVIAEDQETADFLAEGAESLREGFSERTPFHLQSLDFSADAPRPAGESAPLSEAPRGGLNLSA